MKIATFNINNVRARLDNLLGYLKSAKPDVVCLQELKATDAEFPAAALKNAGYGAVWRGQKSWNGVAILARGAEPVLTRDRLPGDPADREARYIEAAVNGVIVTSLYAPNGNPQPGPKFKYKLAWMDRLLRHAADLCASGVPIVLAGDYNVVPTDFDIYVSKSGTYRNNALVQPQPRQRFQELLTQGWVDAIRTIHPKEPMYTFWDYLRNAWLHNSGLRIDHLLLSPAAATMLVAASVDRDVRGKPGASDHAPAWIELEGTGKMPRTTSKAASKAPRSKPAKVVAQAKPKKASRMRPLLVIDGDNFAHRSYHALPKSIMRKGKKPAGAILGFCNMMVRLYQAEEPRAVFVGWDTLDASTYRHEEYSDYQSGREFDEALLEQLDVLPQVVEAFGFAAAKHAGYEADDFIASAVAAETKRGGNVIVASGDRDMFQLASDRTTILFPKKGGEWERIDPAGVRERYGVEPEQVPDFIALRGDPSDKLPGARGVGLAGAANLVRKYGTLEALLKAGNFPAQSDELRLFKRIATMDRTAPIPKLPDQKPNWARAAALMREWQINRLAERLEEIACDQD
ncbi:MAG: exodeoxyribonuclease III [Alphaproteobacteria bacterium]|nr:exodeoxyribonuclease III [Alphaproteobacteria bacterium]